MSSKSCERDWIVGGTLSSSVVAIMNTTCGGGSSSDLRSASNACADRRCTSSMMKILWRSRTGVMPRPAMMMSRILSTWVCVAASISRTSMSRPSAISTHGVAHAARLRRRTLHAIERPRQNACRRRLADAARTGEHERVRDAPAGERVSERLGHAALADDLVEPPGPPFAGKHLVGHDDVDVGAPHRGPEDLRHMAETA